MQARILFASFLLFSTLALSRDLVVETHTASDNAFAVNSHLIKGEKQAILVDAQFTLSEAKNVATMVKNSGLELKQIFITHAHPDHYFGLELLQREFPNAKIVAQKDVVTDIKATGKEKLDYWKTVYKDEMPSQVVIPEATEEKALSLEGHRIVLVALAPGESEYATAVYLPSSKQKTLISGDLLFSKVHLWLAENRSDSWLRNLTVIEGDVLTHDVRPGHGKPAGPELFQENKKYINDFVSITKNAKSKEDASGKLKQQYPDYLLPVIADISVDAVVK